MDRRRYGFCFGIICVHRSVVLAIFLIFCFCRMSMRLKTRQSYQLNQSRSNRSQNGNKMLETWNQRSNSLIRGGSSKTNEVDVAGVLVGAIPMAVVGVLAGEAGLTRMDAISTTTSLEITIPETIIIAIEAAGEAVGVPLPTPTMVPQFHQNLDLPTRFSVMKHVLLLCETWIEHGLLSMSGNTHDPFV